MRIDVHNHYLPEQFVDRLLEVDTSVGLEREGEQLYMRHRWSGTASVAAGNRIPVNPGFTDVEERIDWMETYDIDRTLVSVSTPNPVSAAFTPEQSTDLVTAINDGFAEAQFAYPDHIAGLGMLPLRDPDAAVAEVHRIAEDLELPGIALPTAVPGRKLSDPALKPAFDAIDDHDLTAFIHPHGNELSQALETNESFLNPLVVFPTDTAFQIARLIFDGFFDEHDFDVVLSHLGGVLLQLPGRLERGRREMDDRDAAPDRPIVDYVESFYYDTISFHRPALNAAIETVGVDHFVFGTDYPFDEEDVDTGLADLAAVVPKESNRERIMAGTARSLFDL